MTILTTHGNDNSIKKEQHFDLTQGLSLPQGKPKLPRVFGLSVQFWGWFVFIAHVLLTAFKFNYSAGDWDLFMIVEMLNVENVHRFHNVCLSFICIISLILFAMGMLLRDHQLLVYYLAWLTAVFSTQCLLISVFVVNFAQGGFTRRTVEICAELVKFDSYEYDTTTLTSIVGLVILMQTFVNGTFLVLSCKTYQFYYRVTPKIRIRFRPIGDDVITI